MRNDNCSLVCSCGCAVAAFTLLVSGGNLFAQGNAAAPAPQARGGFGGFGGFGGSGGPPPAWIEKGYDDHQNMMGQLGIKTLRPGKSGNNQTGPGFDDATGNEWMSTMPDALTLNSAVKPSKWWNLWETFPWGSPTKKVTTAKMWWTKRKPEIHEDFEREIYGRVPAYVPKVTWEVTSVTTNADAQTITRMLVGHVDNSIFTNISVNIRASFTVPANTPGPVPVLISFGGVGGGGFGGFGGFGRGGTNANRGGFGGFGGGISQQALSHGWGYGSIDPASIQADAGGDALREGIIGLVNKGQPRKPDQWGALRAWDWGVGRLIDYFEANPDSKVDPKKVGIEGVSRYGKAALVTEAFEPRVAVALVGSSGEGGAKLHRHDYGEAVENLTGGEYYWMAGNFLKYGASDINGKSMNASDLPVDSHELLALCAPRPCFISEGSESGGDPKWIDHPGSYRAGILASKVYELLGAKGYGDDIKDWVHAPLPPVTTLVGGQLAFRQHTGGHTDGPNVPAFFDWIGNYIKSPYVPATSEKSL